MQLSTIDLHGMKADWVGWMMVLRLSFSLVAKILVISLYTTLHKAIGLNCFTLFAAGLLGIRAKKVWFTALPMFPPWKILCTTLITSSPMTPQSDSFHLAQGFCSHASTILPEGPPQVLEFWSSSGLFQHQLQVVWVPASWPEIYALHWWIACCSSPQIVPLSNLNHTHR